MKTDMNNKKIINKIIQRVKVINNLKKQNNEYIDTQILRQTYELINKFMLEFIYNIYIIIIINSERSLPINK